MDFPTGIFIIVVIYGVLLFFDTFFKTCAHYPYLQFLKGTGFEIKLFQVRWTTAAFNRLLMRWGIKFSSFLNFWFNTGIYASLILLPASFSVLFISLYQDFFSKSSSENGVMLQPIVPYINLPASEIGYYSISLLISSFYHELGHALAAATEDIHIVNLGANVILILPVAYVNLSSDKLFNLNKWKFLKIICAGVWHNIILAALFYLLYVSAPTIFSLFFNYGSGVFISELSKKSPVYGEKGLAPGDTITQINDCVVTDENSWYECLRTIRNTKPGFCVHSDLVNQLDESVPLKHFDSYVSCCDSSKTNNLCFEYLVETGVLELPPYACLPGRKIVEASTSFCSSVPHFCPADLHCFRPLFKNNTNLFKVKRLFKPDVIYVGAIYDFGGFKVSPYVPSWVFSTSEIPDVCVKLFGYITVFSLGLAIVNILPCAYMDGQYICDALVSIVFKYKLNESNKKIVSNGVVICVTLLLILHLSTVIFTKFIF